LNEDADDEIHSPKEAMAKEKEAVNNEMSFAEKMKI
jgi:hypothetical protein